MSLLSSPNYIGRISGLATTCLHCSSPVKYDVVSDSLIEKRFNEVEKHVEDPEEELHDSDLNTLGSKTYRG